MCLIEMSDSDSLPSDIEEAASSAVYSLLPEKSKLKYEQTYDRFAKWCDEKRVKNAMNEKVFMAYFQQLTKNYKSSSLWAYYSVLKSVIVVDIGKYTQLIAYLKRQSVGYKPKKSKIFTKNEVVTFLKEAGNKKHMLNKVALIIGLAGACRKVELCNLLLENVEDEEQVFHIQIPDTKTKLSRDFFVTSGGIEVEHGKRPPSRRMNK